MESPKEGERVITLDQRHISMQHLRARGLRCLVLGFCVVVGTISIFGAYTPIAYAQANSAELVVWQAFTTDQLNGVDSTFDYRMEAITAGAPMPSGSQAGIYDWQMTKNERLTISIPLEGVSEQDYEYRLYQNVSDKKPDYHYDDTVYVMHLYLLPNAQDVESVALVVYNEDTMDKEPDPGWTVQFEAPDEDPGGDTPSGSDDPPKPVDPPGLFSYLVQTADTLDITVLVIVAITAGVVVVVSMRKRKKALSQSDLRSLDGDNR